MTKTDDTDHKWNQVKIQYFLQQMNGETSLPYKEWLAELEQQLDTMDIDQYVKEHEYERQR